MQEKLEKVWPHCVLWQKMTIFTVTKFLCICISQRALYIFSLDWVRCSFEYYLAMDFTPICLRPAYFSLWKLHESSNFKSPSLYVNSICWSFLNEIRNGQLITTKKNYIDQQLILLKQLFLCCNALENALLLIHPAN